MPIPRTDREIYAINPLEAVICQLRFPTILRIDNVPSGYQERIRQRYPLYTQRSEGSNAVPTQFLEQIPVELRDSLFPTSIPTYDFISKDKNWTLSLNRDFLALTCRSYEKWEVFKEHLVLGVQALFDEYEPIFFSRIGLRYQNVIRRSKLGLESRGWQDLLNPHVSGELYSHEIGDMILETKSDMLLSLDQWNSKLHSQHGLVVDQREDSSRSEKLYLLDNDLFVEGEKGITDVFTILDYLNQQNGYFFRWCITPTLKKALGTKELTDQRS